MSQDPSDHDDLFREEITSSSEDAGPQKAGSARAVPSDLTHLASPFAHIPAPADLIDLWDEADGFFDALEDPHALIEPEGLPTFSEALDLTNSAQEGVTPISRHAPSLITSTDPPRVDKDPFQAQLRDQLIEIQQAEESAVRWELSQATANQHIVSRPELRVDAQRQAVKPLDRAEQDGPRFQRGEDVETARPSLLERFDQRHGNRTKVVVVGGGKGGVGRSMIVANLALSISKLSGGDVAAVDLDPIGSNLHTYLGLEPLISSPGQVLRRRFQPIIEQCPHLPALLLRSPYPLCSVVPTEEREQLLKEALDLDVEWIIIDVGCLADPFSLKVFAEATTPLAVYTPDPSAVERGHAFLRAALYRQLIDCHDDASALARSLLNADHAGQITSPHTLISALKRVHPEASMVLEHRIKRFQPMLIINQCRTRNDRMIGEELCSVLRRMWRIDPKCIGSISFHHVVQQSLSERTPLITSYPSASTSLDIERIARVLKRQSERSPEVSFLSVNEEARQREEGG